MEGNHQHKDDFLYKENMINIVCVSTDEQKANDLTQLLTEAKEKWKGYWIREKEGEDYRFVSYARWPNIPPGAPTTIYADTMIADVADHDDFKLVEEYVRSRGRIPQIILYSSINMSDLEKTFRHHNCKWINKDVIKGDKLREIIAKHYFDLLKLIKETFEKFDKDGNGTIEKDEIKKAASELGENVTTEDFDKCFEVMDDNHDGVITFREFVTWWKLGRQNSALMKRIVQLELMTSKMLKTDTLVELRKELEGLKHEKVLSKFWLKIFSDEVPEPGFQVNFHGIKGIERIDLVRTYLHHFHPHANTAIYSRWIDLTFSFHNSVQQNDSYNLLKEAKVKFMNLLELINPIVYESITRLFTFEYFKFLDDNSVVIRMGNKVETQKQLDIALVSLIQLLQYITTTQEVSFDIKTQSSLRDVLKGKINIVKALFNYSLEVKSNLDRGIMRVLCSNVHGDFLKFISLMLAPMSTKFECHMKMESLLEALNINTDKLEKLVDLLKFAVPMVKGFVKNDMLEKLNTVQVCLNGLDIFLSLKMKVDGLFS
jgi:hypothetical protein